MSHNTPTTPKNISTRNDSPCIYVACLAAYNNGKLHGAWIDATLGPDAILAAVQAMLAASPEPDASEWAIHDYEGFYSLTLSEWEGFADVHAYAIFIEAHGRLGAKLLAYANDIDHAKAMLEEDYAGCYQCLADFAQELTEETTTIPKNLTYYIDYERMACDMEMSGDVTTFETAHDEVHIFWQR